MANDEQFAERIKHPERFLRLPEVKTRTGLARSTIYFFIAQGRFPKPVHISPQIAVWVESEVQDWIRKKIATSPSKMTRAQMWRSISPHLLTGSRPPTFVHPR
jgi:prophage regulatory protein